MRIVIIDDDVDFRRSFLSVASEVVSAEFDEFATSQLATTGVGERYDVAIVDPFVSRAVSATANIELARGRATRVIVVTHERGPSDLARAAAHHVDGYWLKSDALDVLVGALKSVLDGAPVVVSCDLGPILFTMLAARGDAPKRTSVLTAREVEVLQLAAAGSTNRQIAQRLGIADNTVKNHMRHILGKLHVRSRLGAVLVGVHDGIVDVDAATA